MYAPPPPPRSAPVINIDNIVFCRSPSKRLMDLFSGYCQIPVSGESSKLLTFNTPVMDSFPPADPKAKWDMDYDYGEMTAEDEFSNNKRLKLVGK